jgi:proteasome lid subunit RPN8/RPN11
VVASRHEIDGSERAADGRAADGLVADGLVAERAAAEPALASADSYYPGSGGLAHPGPQEVHLPAAMRAEIVGHALRERPNEACGLIVGDRPADEGGVALRWVPTRNVLSSPYRYEIDPDDLLRVTIETDDDREMIWGIVHSHVASPARPSPTDLRQSHYPGAIYLLVSLDPAEADPTTGAESLQAWRIVGGGVHEVALR